MFYLVIHIVCCVSGVMHVIEKTSVLSGNTHCMPCVRCNVCYREDKCSIW